MYVKTHARAHTNTDTRTANERDASGGYAKWQSGYLTHTNARARSHNVYLAYGWRPNTHTHGHALTKAYVSAARTRVQFNAFDTLRFSMNGFHFEERQIQAPTHTHNKNKKTSSPCD